MRILTCTHIADVDGIPSTYEFRHISFQEALYVITLLDEKGPLTQGNALGLSCAESSAQVSDCGPTPKTLAASPLQLSATMDGSGSSEA